MSGYILQTNNDSRGNGMRLLLAALFVGIEIVFGLFAAQGNATLLIVLGLVVIATLAICKWPELSTLVVLFGMYMNLPSIGVNLYHVPPEVALAFPLLLVFPLATYLLFRREGFIVDKTFVWMCIYLVAQLVSTVFAFSTGDAVDNVFTYITEGMLLYFLLINVVRTEKQVRHVIWVLLIAGGLMGGLTVYQEVNHDFNNNYGGLAQRGGSFVTDEEADEWRDRAAGPVGEINRYAQVLLVLVPLGLFRFWGERSRWLKFFALLLTGLSMAGVILTFSRGAAVALILVLLSVCYLWRVKIHHMVIGLAAIFLFITLVAPDYVGRVATITQVQAIVDREAAGQEADRSIQGRATENLAAWYMFLDHSIIGVGPDNYRDLYQQYAEPIGLRVHVGKERPAHNLYLSIAAEMGIVGLGIFLTMVGIVIQRLLRIRALFPDKKAEIVNMATGAIIALLAYLFSGMFLHMAFYSYFFMLLVVCGAVANIGEAKLRALKQQEIRAIDQQAAAAAALV